MKRRVLQVGRTGVDQQASGCVLWCRGLAQWGRPCLRHVLPYNMVKCDVCGCALRCTAHGPHLLKRRAVRALLAQRRVLLKQRL